MIIGFTGTRHGMTPYQKGALAQALSLLEDVSEAHHGDCVGGDVDFHNIIRASFKGTRIVVHPSSSPSWRAYLVGDIILQPKEPLIRNHDIVDSSDLLFAASHELSERLRSGTWATIRYARQIKKPHTILWPDGQISHTSAWTVPDAERSAS